MKNFIVLFSFLFSLVALGSEKFASGHTVALDGVISDGVIYSQTNSNWQLNSQIKEQLMYTIGQFNGLKGGSPDMNRLRVKIKNVTQLSYNNYKVTYDAQLFIAWPKERPVPRSYDLLLPQRGSGRELQEFFNTYNKYSCLDSSAHNVTVGIFWYYYRPEKRDCSIKTDIQNGSSLALQTKIALRVSGENTKNKYPEYEKIWEDGKLIATLIFGKAEEGAVNSWDAGISAYSSTVNSILRTYGVPRWTNVELNRNSFSEAAKNPVVQLVFDHPEGEIDITLFLVDGIRVASREFYSEYNRRTLNSDYISYSGHSGLGANIRSLANMGTFRKDQYQIFLINGCDTFAYVDDALRLAHQNVNPAFAADKFIDVITNAMPSFFHMNSHSNMVILKALVEKQDNYREILERFDQNQRALVTGEQDNRWPAPFL